MKLPAVAYIRIIGCSLSPHKLQKYCHQPINTIFISYVDVVHILCIPCMQSKNNTHKNHKNSNSSSSSTYPDGDENEKGPHFKTRLGYTLSITLLTLLSARLNYAIAIKIKRTKDGKPCAKPHRALFLRSRQTERDSKKTDTFFNISKLLL